MVSEGSDSNKRGRKWWEKFTAGPARDYANDPEKLRRLVETVFKKLSQTRPHGRMKEVWEDLQTLTCLVRAWALGDYREIPYEAILLAIGAVFYFLLPTDAIHDWILALGYVDDAGVIAWVLSAIKGELQKFKSWEKAQPSGGKRLA